MLILVVEDDMGLSVLINGILEDLNFETFTLHSANDAIHWLKTQQPYLMILDYSLPEMNGKELIAELINDGITIPSFIVATGQGDEKIAVEMMKLGARDYVIKDRFFLELLPEIITRVGREIENEIKRKQAEMHIIELNESLERKVIERTAELNSALRVIEDSNLELKQLNENIADEARKLLELNDKLAISETELKIANQTKDKFFSIIAHDLRNPIGGIKNLLELIITRYNEMEIQEIIQLTKATYNASLITYELLENLLEWANIQRGNLKFQPVLNLIRPIIDRVIGIVKINADNKSITINNKIDNNIEAFFDRDFFNTILRNLMTNAIKFSKVKSEINISISDGDDVGYKYSGFYIITVSDSGTGISNDLALKLFKENIVKSTLGTNNEQGSGLGLQLCKEFVEKHKGKIWVESEEGRGSDFKFTIPKTDIINLF